MAPPPAVTASAARPDSTVHATLQQARSVGARDGKEPPTLDEQNPFGPASERRQGARRSRDAGASFEDLVAEIFPDAEQAAPELLAAQPASRFGRWLAVAGFIVVLAAGGYLLRDWIVDIVVGRSDAPSLTPGDDPLAAGRPPVANHVSTVPLDATEQGAEPVLPPVATPVPTPEPEPLPPARVDPASLAAATRVLSARFEPTAGGGVVILQGDGGIVSRRVRSLRLENPPRQLVRISGIVAQPVPETVPVGGALVARIRMGHHPELSPPELYVVLDLAAASVRVGTPESTGDTVRIPIASGS